VNELCEIIEDQKRLQIEGAFVGERGAEEERSPCWAWRNDG